ncbi:MAG: hypothetical protein ACI9EF_001850 [Pseudohongiellaceae bacterium]|jgi:hypothetical protein
MSGGRILIAMFLGLALLLWLALDEGEDADIRRGLEETAVALDAVTAELASFDDLYQQLSRRGLMLRLKTEHDGLRAQLATLRARRLHIPDDPTVERPRKLRVFRELRDEANQLFAMTSSLGMRVNARHEFITLSSPRLNRCRELRDKLLAYPLENDELTTRVSAMSGHFAELEGFAKQADSMLHSNINQGQILGQTTLNGLADCITNMVELDQTVREHLGLPPESE